VNIQELIENGKEAIQIERALVEERRREAEEQERLERKRQFAALHQGLLDALPEVLHPFVDLSAVELQPYALERAFPVQIAGCTEIRVRVGRDSKASDVWQLAGYIVYVPTNDQFPDKFEVDWVTQRYGPDDLEKVLGAAALAHERELDISAELEAQRKQWEEQQEAWARAQDDREMELEIERAYELEEKNKHLALITRILRDDPLARALVEAFIVAREKRMELENRLDNASHDIEFLERRYRERMEQAQHDAQSAADQARELERRVWDAEEKARKLEKEAKAAQKGW
jgi:hypothetical protein